MEEHIPEMEYAEPVSVTEVKGPRGKKIRVIREWREALATIIPEEAVAWDLETGGLNPWQAPIAVLSLYGEQSQVPCILHLRGAVPGEVARFLESPRLWISHNGTNFDRLFLEQEGIDTFAGGMEHYDTLVGEAVAKLSGRHDVRINLQATLARRIGKKIAKDADHHSWMNEELDPKQVAYCVDDVFSLHRLRHTQIKDCAADGRKRALEVEQKLTNVVCAMILTGLPIDLEAFDRWQEESAERILQAQEYMLEVAGPINFGSTQQVKRVFNEVLGLDLQSTRAEVLEDLAQYETPAGLFAKNLSLWRKGTKRTGMYDPEWMNQYVQADGRMHGRFWQVGTETGRFSGSDPNLQQWPRDGRMVVGGEDGMLMVYGDYDAIEVMVAAGLAGDRQLLEDCLGDPHMRLAMHNTGLAEGQIDRELRRTAKAANFTLLFCGGVKRFWQSCVAGGSKMSLQEARTFVDEYLRLYEGIDRMRNAAFRQAERGTAELNFPTGLRRVLVGPEVTPTRIVNNIVQGTAAAGLKYGLLEMWDRGMVRGYLGATVHDENVACVPKRIAPDYKAQMEEAMVLGMNQAITGIPTRVHAKIDTHWS